MPHCLLHVCDLRLEAPFEPIEALSPPEHRFYRVDEAHLDGPLREALDLLGGRLLEINHWRGLLRQTLDGASVPEVLQRRVWAVLIVAATGLLGPFGLPLDRNGHLPARLESATGVISLSDLCLSPDQWPGLSAPQSVGDLAARYRDLRQSLVQLQPGALEAVELHHLCSLSVVTHTEEELI